MLSAHETVLQNIADHLSDIDLLMYLGSDSGAHQPVYFTEPKNILSHVTRAQKFMQVLRTTPSLYSAPHRTMESAELVWAIIADFDYDRFEMTGMDRGDQECLLMSRLQNLPPTFAVQTRAGFHLYWVLKEPEPIFSYAYTASILRDAIQADPSTVVFTHCMTIYSLRKTKPGHIVQTLVFPENDSELKLQGFQTHTLDEIQQAFRPSRSTISKDFLAAVAEFTGNGRVGGTAKKFQMTSERRFMIDEVVESLDTVRFLRMHGYQAYSRGRGKIVTTCPYHLDRHPSAFIDTEPTSEYYGLFHCVSCGKKRSLPNLISDIENGKV